MAGEAATTWPRVGAQPPPMESERRNSDDPTRRRGERLVARGKTRVRGEIGVSLERRGAVPVGLRGAGEEQEDEEVPR